MRLKQSDIECIKQSFIEVFDEGEIYLFGSRTDDTMRGGDIDLYIVPGNTDSLTQKKFKFLVALKKRIGNQKIDVVIKRGSERSIDVVATKEGILICRHYRGMNF